ncbi:MAG: hypothetical protein ACI9PP_002292 [Halobacteriales archaeon]|jgi:hypothetical protein
MNRTVVLGISLVGLLLIAGTALAHVPEFPRDNNSPERALDVPDPAKSWVFYDEVSANSAAYYSVEMEPGDRLVLQLFTPHSGETVPSLVLMSQEIEGREDIPDGVSVPDGYGARVIDGQRPADADYEPFSPAAFYTTVTVDRRVDAGGTYLVSVYGQDQSTGPAGVVVGYEESFSIQEYLTVPIDRLRIHRWEGQPPLAVFGPGLAVVIGGLVVLGRQLSGPRLTVRGMLGVAALLFLAGAVSVAVQTIIALTKSGPAPGALLSAVFVLVPAVIGAWLLRRALDDTTTATPEMRATLLGAGLVGFLTWGGILLGPALTIIAAILPWERLP